MMAIKSKIFFVHIPKTGGVSIEKKLGEIPGIEVCPAYRAEEFFAPADAPSYGVYYGHLMYYFKEYISPDFTFTVLRDPIERAVSAFEHVVRDKGHNAHGLLVGGASILEALKNDEFKQHIANTMTLYLGLRPEFIRFKTPMAAVRHAQEFRREEQLLESAKQAILDMDFIGFTETLDANQLQLSWLLGVPSLSVFSIANENINPNKASHSYKEMISPDVLVALTEANALDIELYGFAQEVARQRGWLIEPNKGSGGLDSLQQVAQEKYLAALGLRPQISTLDYRFDMPLEGDGWHTRETDGSTYWRFTGPGDRASLYFPRLSSEVSTLTLDVVHAVTLEHFSDFQVIFNGEYLAPAQYQDMQVSFAIPAGTLTHPYTCIEIITLPPIKPAEGDNRKLGIAFSAVKIN